jgi:microcystin-dependent protein
MAWTQPSDWAYKEAPGSSKMNEQVRDNLNYLKAMMPAGVILPYGGATAPTQFLLCDGSAVSRSTYADLYAAIGVAYGVGDGSSTFNLPNYRGRTFLGAGTGAGLTARTLAATGGSETKNLAHTHQVTVGGNARRGSGDANVADSGQVLTSTSGGSATQDTMDPFLVSNVIIKY